MVPTLVGVGLAVLLAFVLGRASAGGGGGEVTAATVNTAATTTTTRVTTHAVARGESLLGIANQYGITLDALAAANGITNANHVFVGQVLQIPPAGGPTTVLSPSTTSTTRKP